MRHEKATQLLRLSRLLASSAEGVTLDEMADHLGIGRRTAERLRDAVREVFPQMEDVDDPPTRRFRIPGGLDGLFQAPDADELAALRGAADALTAQGAGVRAAALGELERKILASMRGSLRRRVAPDIEALVQAETIAVHAGPRPYEDAAVLAAVRTAIKSMCALAFVYDGGSNPGRRRQVTPLGILFGRANYLVASEDHGPPRSWRFDRMREVAALDQAAPPAADFSLQDFADESFGIYHGELQDIVLVIDADRAQDALTWRFHSSQSIQPMTDGRVKVSFRAGGMLELAWHLFTWADAVEIVSPPELKAVMVEELRKALARHAAA